MTAAKHTPGPWVAVVWSCHAPTTVRAGDITIAECSGHGRRTDESIADARLIAAAPELLASEERRLEDIAMMLAWIATRQWDHEAAAQLLTRMRDETSAAIAKARGA